MKHAKILVCATGALITMFPVERSPGQCATITETKKITAPTPTQNDFFGISVALSGDDAISGAKEDQSRSGSAYVYGRNVGGTDNWGLVTPLTPDPLDAPGAGAEFGISVDSAGDFAISGAHRENANGVQNSGSAYIFSRNQGGLDNWGQVAKLTAFDGAADDRFGISVSLSGDVCIVGAHLDDLTLPNRMDAGSAYIFRRDLAGNWNLEQKITASNAAAFAEFGSAVSIEGNLAVVGAPLADSPSSSEGGAAYVFRFDGVSSWTEEIILSESSGAFNDQEQFGNAVAVQSDPVNGDLVVAGAHLFDDCTPCTCQGQGFPGLDNTGAVFVYRRTGGVWGSGTQLLPASCARGSAVGLSVGIEGNRIIVGSVDNASVFTVDGSGVWTETLALNATDPQVAGFGTATAISTGIGLVGANLNGTSDEGASYAFILSSDCNNNGVPDECETDCNGNGIPDDCDIAAGTSADCNGNGIPDVCDTPINTDVIFIIDGSGSISFTAFQLELDGLQNCLCGPNAIITTDGRYSVSVIQFSSNQIVEIPRTIIDSPGTVLNVCSLVDAITQDSQGTSLLPALLEAQNIFNQGFGQNRVLMISTDGGLSDTALSETKCSDL